MKLLKIFLFSIIGLTIAGTAKADLKTSLNNVTRDYFDLQKALSANNSTLASEKAQNLIWDINTITDVGMNEAQHSKWFDYLNKTIRAARGVAQGTSIIEQKHRNSELSNNIFDILKLLSFKGFTVYKQFCTANGYYWLSKTVNAKNPYYGISDKKLQTCGTVQEVLKPGK